MIEKDAVTGIHAVGLTVVDRDPLKAKAPREEPSRLYKNR